MSNQNIPKNKIIVVGILFLILITITVFSINQTTQSNQITGAGETLGTGSKAVTLTIQTPTNNITYNINTDVSTLEDILMEYNLANLTHLGMGSVINSIAGYTLNQNVDVCDFYVNNQIVYTQTNNIKIENNSNYTIKIIN